MVIEVRVRKTNLHVPAMFYTAGDFLIFSLIKGTLKVLHLQARTPSFSSSCSLNYQIPWQCWCPSLCLIWIGNKYEFSRKTMSRRPGRGKQKGFLLKSQAQLGMQGCTSFLQAVAMTMDVHWIIAAPMTAGICTHIYPIRMCNQSNFMHKLAAQLCMPPAHVIVCLIGLKVLFTMCVLIFTVIWHKKQFHL